MIARRTSRNAARLGRVLALAVLVGLAAPGCLSFETPDGFLVVHKRADELKAISTDEAKLWIREFSDDDQGGLAFWSAALKTEFVENRGYTSVGEETIADGRGREGTALVYESTVQGVPRRYLCALFVDEGWWSNTIRTLEFAATKPQFERYEAGVRRSIGTLRP